MPRSYTDYTLLLKKKYKYWVCIYFYANYDSNRRHQIDISLICIYPEHNKSCKVNAKLTEKQFQLLGNVMERNYSFSPISKLIGNGLFYKKL